MVNDNRDDSGNLVASPLATSKEMLWSNEDNSTFCEKITEDGMAKYAEIGGLLNGCDLKILSRYLREANSLLEVGAGYGRVIDFLIKSAFKGKITAIERSRTLFATLVKKYAEKISLLNYDITQCSENIAGQFDLVLMLWSGLADFSQNEQGNVIWKLSKLLSNKGKLIIDTLPINIAPIGSNQEDSQNYTIVINNIKVYTRSPTLKEIEQYASNAGLKKVRHISYYTETMRPRILHILS